MIDPIEPRPHIEAVPAPSEAELVPLPTGPAWWRRTMAELQESEAEARRQTRELRLELDAVGVELARTEAKLATLTDANEELWALHARAERLERQLAVVTASRGYRLSRLTWRMRKALLSPFRRSH